jgi:DNA-binding YbaB/EbfC family protein
MAKQKGRKPFPGGGARPSGGMGGGDMMRQLQQLQEEMARTQEALGSETVEVSVGGGVVHMVMTGHQQLEAVTIAPEILNPEDAEMLQDLILAAVNEAITRSQELASQRMGALTGGLDLGGLL